MTKQIWSVLHIMDGNGNILELNDFNAKYSTSCSNEIHKNVSQNVPKFFLQSIKNNFLNIPTPNLHKVKIDDLDLVNEKCNKFLRQCLVNTLYPGRTNS